MEEGTLHVGELTFVAGRQGYNNQPAFSSDGRGIYYVWRPDDSQADIWYHDLESGMERPLTCTPQEEYSPSPMPGGLAISVVRVDDLSRRRLWRIPLDGGAPAALFPNITSVAYHAWVDTHDVFLYLTVPEQGQKNMLAIGRLPSGCPTCCSQCRTGDLQGSEL